MSSSSQKSAKSPAKSPQQPLRVTPLKTVVPEEEQVPMEEEVLPEQNVDQPMEDHYEEEEVEETVGEATENEAPPKTTVAKSKEKGPDSTPAKSKKRTSSATPPVKRQRAAASNAGSSPTFGNGEEEEGEETTTPVVVKLEKPSRSAFSSNTRSRATSKATTEPTTDISRKSVVLPKAVHMETLEKLGIAEEVQQLFDNIGRGFFLKWPSKVNIALVKEFYSKARVTFDENGVPLTIQNSMGGAETVQSLNEFNQALWADSYAAVRSQAHREAIKKLPDMVNEWPKIWKEMNKGQASFYNSSKTKGNVLGSPALRVCHRILAYNFYGKKDRSNSLSQQEVYILWCMAKKIRLDFGAFAAAQIHSILSKSTQRLSLAHMVTVYAERAEAWTPDHEKNATVEELLDLACLSKMMEIGQDEHGMYCIMDQPAMEKTKKKASKSATPEP